MTDEEYVRVHWERPRILPCPYNEPQRRVALNCGGLRTVVYGSSYAWAWSASAEFTRERLEQIREIEEERAMLCGKLLLEDRDIAACRRILARLESALDELREGMNPPHSRHIAI
jgi:hypothetical protein